MLCHSTELGCPGCVAALRVAENRPRRIVLHSANAKSSLCQSTSESVRKWFSHAVLAACGGRRLVRGSRLRFCGLHFSLERVLSCRTRAWRAQHARSVSGETAPASQSGSCCFAARGIIQLAQFGDLGSRAFPAVLAAAISVRRVKLSGRSVRSRKRTLA